MRLYLNIPIYQLLSKEKCICSNSPQLTLRHAHNCSKLITYRSSLHDAVRDTVFNMARIARISCIKEPLLKETLSLNNFGSDDRGDVYCDWIENSEAVVDFVFCNVANDTLFQRRKLNPVDAFEFEVKEKHRKYDRDIKEANADRSRSFVFIAFPFSINGRLSVEAGIFLNDFQKWLQILSSLDLWLKILSQLLGCKMFQIPDHAYLSPQYGGLGWTKASILTSCAFVGGCRNAIFEFSERFADWEDLLMTTQSSTVFALNEEISRIDVEKWGRCFPQSFNGNIPEKNVLNLKYTLRTLQKRLTGMYEKDLYNNICSSAVLNQDLHSLLLEKGVCENKVSDSSLFVTIVPRRFGLCATNEAFVTKMRLYLNIPINQLLSKEKCICSNSPQLTLRHALNCSKLITYRSSLHDAVRDTVFNMAQTARISCIKEPLLKETLSLNNFGSDDRGDVYCDWIDNSEAIVDFVSCNVANDTLVHRRKLNPVAALDFKAKEKHRKYDKEIEDANIDRNTQLVFIAFPFSINGRLSVEAETFLDDFQKMVKEKTMKRFDIFLWRSRIQFAIINRLPRFFNRIREALARQQANQDFVEEILV
ncbi:hypothetical protein P9112_002601 [Eukaryota sp. TZLM1-RC]